MRKQKEACSEKERAEQTQMRYTWRMEPSGRRADQHCHGRATQGDRRGGRWDEIVTSGLPGISAVIQVVSVVTSPLPGISAVIQVVSVVTSGLPGISPLTSMAASDKGPRLLCITAEYHCLVNTLICSSLRGHDSLRLLYVLHILHDSPASPNDPTGERRVGHSSEPHEHVGVVHVSVPAECTCTPMLNAKAHTYTHSHT